MATYRKGEVTKLSTNFNSTEFDCHGKGCCTFTDVDPQLVAYLQRIRDHFKKPITISSGFRCYTHNRNVGGASNSNHKKGMAADIYINGVKPAEIAKFAESIGVKGIGLYETSKDGFFVHIDTRKTKSFWYGQACAYRSTFGGKATTTTTTTKKAYTGTFPTLPAKGYLAKGDNGTQVKNLQKFLNWFGGYGLTVDGDFGAKTETAVKKFQRANSLVDDGKFGSKSLKAAKAAKK